MSWWAHSAGMWQREGRSSENVPASRLLPLQVIGALSALIFAFNFCLEMFTLLSQGRDRQILILALQLSLAAWAIIEALLLRMRQPDLPLTRLGLLLALQFLVEAVRLSLVLWGPPFGMESNFGIFFVDIGPLAVLIPAYILLFFAISRSLLVIYAREFDDAWSRLTQVAVTQSKQQEREQMLRDMHDGFGSQIATMRIMAEQGRLDLQSLPRYLEEISTDLHLVVDTFAHAADMTLSDALADMRYRLRQRIDPQKTKLHWEIDLSSGVRLEPRTILNILRIVQEALNNALRHGKPSNVWVEAMCGSTADPMRISVRDDGTGMTTMVVRGRGLNNMETRARELGARIAWIDRSPGLEVELVVALPHEP